MLKRWILFVLLASLLFLCGCAGNTYDQTMEETEQDEATLTIWAWDDNFNVKAAKMAGEAIEKVYPDIKVKVESKEQSEILEKLTNGFASGVYNDLPDIVLIEDYQIQNLLYQYEGDFAELTDHFEFENFMDYKVEVSSKDGKNYGIPFDSGVAVMFYRLDLIQAAGYTQEDMENITWEEYIEVGKAVKEKTGCAMLTLDPNDLGLIRIMQQSAGSWYVKEDGKTVHISDNQALKDAMDIYLQLLEQDIVQSITGWDQFVGAFQQGKVASEITGCWAVSSIQEAADQSGLWRVAAIPRMEQNKDSIHASSIGGCSWYILNHSPYVDEAITLMQNTFGGNQDFINSLMDNIKLVTAYKDVEELDAYQEEDPFFGNQKTQVFFAGIAEQVLTVNYGTKTYEIEDALTSSLQSILNGTEKDEALAQTELKAEAILGSLK